MGDFNNPTPRLISFAHGRFFFSPGTHMRNESMFDDCQLCGLSGITGIGAGIFFRSFLLNLVKRI